MHEDATTKVRLNGRESKTLMVESGDISRLGSQSTTV